MSAAEYEVYVSVSGAETVERKAVTSAADYLLSFGTKGDYSIVYEVVSEGETLASKELSFKVIAYEERDINKGIGFYTDKGGGVYGGQRYYDGVEYAYFTGDGNETLFYTWFREANANDSNNDLSVEDMDLEACAIELYMYAHFNGQVNNAEVHIGNCTMDNYWDAMWTYKYWFINSIPSDKLVKLTLRISDAGKKQSDTQEVFDAINSMVIYIAHNGDKAGEYMLVSDFRIITTAKATGIEVVSDTFVPVLTSPTASGSFVGGDYQESYNIIPTVEKEGYTDTVKVEVKVGYDGNWLNSYVYEGTIGEEINALMANDLAAYSFPTGRNYTVNVKVYDKYGNYAVADLPITITGTAPDTEAPVINTENAVKEAVRGDVIDLSLVAITDNADAGSDLSVVYNVTVNGQTITVENDKFTAAYVGVYAVKITVSDSSENSSSAEYAITVSKKTDALPSITVPETFRLEYTTNGQVVLSQITAAAEDGTAIQPVYTVTGPDGKSVDVKNNKFENLTAGEYTIVVTATDGDGNVATRTVKITVAGNGGEQEESSETKGCFGSFGAMGSLALCLAAFAVFAGKKKRV